MTSQVARPEHGIAWITGASSGIGRATALELARRGWRVAVSARNAAALEEVAEASSGRVRAFACDVTDPAAVDATIARIEAEQGPIALAFLNAGLSIHDRAPDLDAAVARRVIETNVLGLYNALAPLIGRMAARRRGQIALCASVAGYVGLPFAAAYCASKAAAISTAVSLAVECAPLGIRVQCVNPGFVDTPLTARNDFPMPFLMSPEQAARRIADGFSGGRFEIAFPRRLVWPMKLIGLLPYRAAIALLRLGARRGLRGRRERAE